MNVINKKPWIITLFPAAVFLFISAINGYGQEILSKEQEREIKLSGKYYYSECSSFDETDAKECAVRDLTQTVIVDMIKQTIKSDEVEIKNALEMQAQTARLNLTGRIRVLAWIPKDNVRMDANPSSTQAATSAQESSQAQESTNNSVTANTSATTSEPESAVSKPETSAIANPIVRDLASCETFEQFRRTADGFKRQGKMVYGTNKTAFPNPENCHVAVFTSQQKLVALLDVGKHARTDLLTGQSIQNMEQRFAGHMLYWLQINN